MDPFRAVVTSDMTDAERSALAATVQARTAGQVARFYIFVPKRQQPAVSAEPAPRRSGSGVAEFQLTQLVDKIRDGNDNRKAETVHMDATSWTLEGPQLKLTFGSRGHREPAPHHWLRRGSFEAL